MSERLNQIEAILNRLAERQEDSDRKFEETREFIREIASRNEETREFIREIASRNEETREFIREIASRNEETRAIANSNARTIQAMLDRQESERLEHQENIARLDTAILKLTDVQQAMAKWLANVDDNQPTILRRLTSIENKIDRLLDNP